MNIFYLHENPQICAQMHIDKHCVKMILESAQLLCSVHRVLDGTEYYDKTANGRKIKRWRHPDPKLEKVLYKAGWIKHPSTMWLMESAFNYNWLYRHMMALNEEFKKRYSGKDHLAITKLKDALRNPPKNAPLNKKPTLPTPAMPEECKVPGDTVKSYRNYYVMKKQRFATWKSPSKMPDWYAKAIIVGHI